MRRLYLPIFLLALLLGTLALAQTPPPEYAASATLDCENGIYKCGDEATMSVTVKHNGEPMTAGTFEWNLTDDGVRKIASGKCDLSDKPAVIKGTLAAPGILRLTISKVDEKSVWIVPIGAGYEVDKLRPTCVEPDDFVQYWEAQKALVRAIPADVQLEKVDAQSNAQQTTYKFSIANINNTRQYGWLSVPTAPGKYPAHLTVPAAGWKPYGPSGWLAAQGFITMVLYAHNYPVDLPVEKYDELQKGELKDYMVQGRDNRDTCYYRRVFLGCTRFMDYLMARPEWDGKNLIVQGSSQGGGLSLICAGLEPKVTAISSNVPALCDHTGCLTDRACGWPRFIPNNDQNIAKVSAYYDAVNFARHAKCASLVSTGFADGTCPPTSVYSAYSVLPEPKRMVPTPDMGHSQSKEFSELSGEFIKNLGKLP